MATVTVYAFRYYSAEHAEWFLGAGKCRWEHIADNGWRAIEESAEEVDESLVPAEGVYFKQGK